MRDKNSPEEREAMKEESFVMLKDLAPDLMGEIEKRALLLEQISFNAPIGRRQLAVRMKLPEREVRSVADILRFQGLITLESNGMLLTEKGEKLLPFAGKLAREMRELTQMEEKLSTYLHVKRVLVTLGNADDSSHVLKDVGKLAAQQLRKILQNGMTLAVTGGSTIAQVANHLTPATPMNVMVVPARGGIGRNVAQQANTLAEEIGKKLGGHYRLMHLPDQMDAHAMQEMLRVAEVKETVELLQRADVILHGVGRADEMSKSRNLPATVVHQLKERKAVAESFGYYFDEQGKFLYAASSIGVDLARLKPDCKMIAVAAGEKKAKALLAVLRHFQHEMLVTDEGATKEMIRLLEAP
ncbi:MAG: hypothetical protein GX786_03670 [Clostridiales bacterium]|nr:hypothetical protein [Clostridiales bacterium]